jgi:hypothetical protein
MPRPIRVSSLRAVTITAALFLAAAAPPRLAGAPNPKNIIVIQPNSPVGITEYKAEFEQANAANGINHVLSYTNRGRQKISAVRFGLVAFDVFNGFLGKIEGVAMSDVNVNRSHKGNWIHTPPTAFSFLTGVAYVDTVRFEDGTIWQADPETVVEELRKIDKGFDGRLLKPAAK